jgi:6-pyruvoyltetrahydropterin/6-carboxytetrahydropterin synthase
MKVSITKMFTFDAAHQLPWHRGKCRNLHGHTYRLEVTLAGPINEDGIVIDFADLSDAVQSEILDRYDHQFLNNYFDNPTAELLAASFFKQLESRGLDLAHLTLWETPTSAATVEREDP